jgi:O-succinylbenzoate synthase
LEALELRRLRLPLVTPFRSAHGVERERDVLLVRAITETGDGWGECAALRAPTYTAEYVDGCVAVITEHLAPRLFRAPLTAADVAVLLAPVRGHPMAKAALEAAVLDAELRAADTSLARRLGAVRQEVEVGVAVGIVDDVGALLDQVDGYVAAGYWRVKLKVQPGWDVVPVTAVRDRHPGLALQVDANGAYSLDDLSLLLDLDQLGLLLIEQPLAVDDLVGHAEVAKKLATPICLDESVESADDLRTAIALGACGVLNLKPGRVGGYLAARAMHDQCVAAGVPMWCGGMLETGIGRAANLALAALPGFTLPGDLSGSSRYFHQDVTPPLEPTGGRMVVPAGPGIGVAPIPAVLAARTTWRAVLRR